MVEAERFREALKDFPAGVTIVTSADGEGRPLGATVSAFTSLSLRPPLVLVCLREGSRTATGARDRRAFAIHFLDRNQVELARLFAIDDSDKFDQAGYSLNGSGVPCLDTCSKVLECSLEMEYAGGDHVILVGRVENVRQSPQFEPLVYAQRTFFGLGSELAG
jgi:flavin reductase (DIM6/NTAB) family NADH-FMN oxidoreductase RutF